jgi:hypothetical protein
VIHTSRTALVWQEAWQIELQYADGTLRTESVLKPGTDIRLQLRAEARREHDNHQTLSTTKWFSLAGSAENQRLVECP